MALHKLVRSNYGGKLLVSIKYENLHSFKEGVILLCQSILETRRISYLHGSALFTISLRRRILASNDRSHFQLSENVYFYGGFSGFFDRIIDFWQIKCYRNPVTAVNHLLFVSLFSGRFCSEVVLFTKKAFILPFCFHIHPASTRYQTRTISFLLWQLRYNECVMIIYIKQIIFWCFTWQWDVTQGIISASIYFFALPVSRLVITVAFVIFKMPDCKFYKT